MFNGQENTYLIPIITSICPNIFAKKYSADEENTFRKIDKCVRPNHLFYYKQRALNKEKRYFYNTTVS